MTKDTHTENVEPIKPDSGPGPWSDCGLSNAWCKQNGRCIGHSSPTPQAAVQGDELTQIFETLNGSGSHACYCPRSTDGGCTCALKDEYLKEQQAVDTTQTTKLQAEAYKIGDIVTNVSGWGVGSNDNTPLKVKSILLQVEWDGAKSTRWLSSKEIKHLEREHKIGEDGE